MLDLLRRSSWPALAGRGRRAIAQPVNHLMGAATGIDDRSLVSHATRRRAADAAFAAVVMAALGWGLYSMLAYIAAGQQGLGILGHAFGPGFLTFLRVAVVVAVSSVIWVPVGVWIGFSPRVASTLGKSFSGVDGYPVPVLEDITLDVYEGEFVALLGRSGSGKSTLLRCIAGLIAPSEGEVLFRGKRLEGTNRDTTMVFQTCYSAGADAAAGISGAGWPFSASVGGAACGEAGRCPNRCRQLRGVPPSPPGWRSPAGPSPSVLAV